MRYVVVLFALTWLISCEGAGSRVSLPFSDDKGQPVLEVEVINENEFETRLADMINAKRQELGLSTLITDTLLMQVAEAHSLDMSTRNYLEHESPEGDHAGERLTNGGYQWKYWGEVIAGGSVSPQETFDGWMNSPRHKAVLMDGVYEEVGLGFVTAVTETKYVRYWTVVVAIPKPRPELDEGGKK